jgi:hypothetical protein
MSQICREPTTIERRKHAHSMAARGERRQCKKGESEVDDYEFKFNV